MSFLTRRSVFRQPSLVFTVAIVATALLFSSWGSANRNHTYTAHALMLNEAAFSYQSDAGYLTVAIGKQAVANVFYTAYTAGNSDTNRPITFVFNGGPGSASVWLHMGASGPVRAVPGKVGYGNNPDTWLGFTDLVFIDPVGTGYSRPADGGDATLFYGYHQDVKIIGAFIQSYLHSHQRQQSKVFLAGESYGAARAVGLTAYLQDSLQTTVRGLTLISPALDYRLITFKKGNDEAYPYYLPGFAVAAKYHHRLTSALDTLSVDDLQAKVSKFAVGTYKAALQNGGNVSQEIIDTLSSFIGLSPKFIKAKNGRISDQVFTSALLKTSNVLTGTFDSRATGADSAIDPSEAAMRSVFVKAFNNYLKQELHFKSEVPYLATIPTPTWSYDGQTKDGYFNVTGTLKHLLQQHPQLKVQVITGAYDLATPPATVNAALAEVGLNEFNSQITINHYQAGHMVYTDNQANHQFKINTERFYHSI